MEPTDGIIQKRHDYYRIALAFCGNPHDAMDAVSDMTLTVIEKYGSLRDKNAFDSWSRQILINICRKYLRQRKRSIYLEDMPEELSGGDRPGEISPDLKRALSAIGPKYREAVTMKYLLDYPYRDIAAALRIPVGTAQSRCDYGLKRMREALGGDYDE